MLMCRAAGIGSPNQERPAGAAPADGRPSLPLQMLSISFSGVIHFPLVRACGEAARTAIFDRKT